MTRPARFTVPASLLVLAACLAAPAPATPAKETRPIRGRVDAYLAPVVALDIFQGTILLARGDRILLEQGYGFANVEHSIPNSPRSVFRIASLSKVATDVALGTLVESGKIRLEDPLSRFLPEFPRGAEITLDLLRNHRAGIPSLNSIPFDEEAHALNTLDSMVRVIAKHPLDFEPGARRSYSNGGYAVLARVIEAASGMSYADYLRQAVFTPLGMTHTRHEADGDLVPNRASGVMASQERRHGFVAPPFQQMATKTGGGSLISTTGDLHRLLRAMYRDNVVRAGTWWTLFPRSDSTYSFQGRCPGYNVYMVRDFAIDADVVMLANNYSCGMAGDIGNALLRIAAGEAASPPAWRADLPFDSVRCARYVGDYRAPAGQLPYGDGPFEVRWRNGGLVLSVEGAPKDFLLPQPDGSFLLRNFWSEMRFPQDDETPSPRATLRPLWFRGEGVAVERVAARRE